MPWLFLLFVAMPVIELWLLLKLGSWLGVLPTIVVVIGTGFFGAWLARREGFRVLAKFAAQVEKGGLPAEAMIDGVAIFVGGALLMTPGIVTDVFGFSLLLPPSRALFRRGAMAWAQKKIAEGTFVMGRGPLGGTGSQGFGSQGPGFGAGSGFSQKTSQGGVVIDQEFEEDDSPKNSLH